MAGEDDDFIGEAWAAEGVKVGYLPQEPQLDPSKDVLGNVMEGAGETKALLDRFEEVIERLRRALDADDGHADRRAGRAAGEDRRRQRLGARPHGRDRDGRAALPAGRRRRRQAVGRRAPPRGAVPAAAAASPTCCCSTSRPTISTPSRWPGWSAILDELPGHRRGRHPRPLLPRQRRRLDPRARPRRAASRGRATTRPGWSRRSKRLEHEEKTDDAAPPHAAARARMGAARAPRARQAKSKARIAAYEELLAEEQREATLEHGADRHPGRARGSATWWSRPSKSPRASATGC